jgi:hypothetical protein
MALSRSFGKKAALALVMTAALWSTGAMASQPEFITVIARSGVESSLIALRWATA